MDATSPEAVARRESGQMPLSPLGAVLLAISFGLFAGYMDLGVMLFKKTFLNQEGAFRSGRDFPWTVPLGHVVLMMIPGLIVAVTNRIRPKPLSLRTASWWFATLAIWGALLRLPMNDVCRVIMAVGAGRWIGTTIVSHGLRSRLIRSIRLSLVGLLLVLAALSTGWQVFQEYRAVAGLPAAPSGARNVVLIVWDTVRSYNLSLSGYHRDTTPFLKRWAQRGVNYRLACARSLDVSLTYLLLHRPVALRAQYPVEVPPGYAPADPGRVPGLTRLSDRRVRGKHQLL